MLTLGKKIRSMRTGRTGVICGYTIIQIPGCGPRVCYVMALDEPIEITSEDAEFASARMLTMNVDCEYVEEVETT